MTTKRNACSWKLTLGAERALRLGFDLDAGVASLSLAGAFLLEPVFGTAALSPPSSSLVSFSAESASFSLVSSPSFSSAMSFISASFLSDAASSWPSFSASLLSAFFSLPLLAGLPFDAGLPFEAGFLLASLFASGAPFLASFLLSPVS